MASRTFLRSKKNGVQMMTNGINILIGSVFLFSFNLLIKSQLKSICSFVSYLNCFSSVDLAFDDLFPKQTHVYLKRGLY